MSCFDHPSKMVYPPGMIFTPASSPPPPASRDDANKRGKWEDYVARDHLHPEYDTGSIKSESQ